MKFKRYPQYKDSGVEWLGEIPEHWDVQKLKHIASVRFSSVNKKTEDGERPALLCNYQDVYYNDYITSDIAFMEATASPAEIAGFTLRKGDVIVTKDSESWDDIAVSAYVPFYLDGVLCGYHLAQIHSYPALIDGEYLFRSFGAHGINDQFRVAATGITRYGLGKYWIDNAFFPVPPLDEQEAINTCLNCETTKIDALIEKKERLIELLKEKRTALITHAVTKGLPAAAAAQAGLDQNAPMKDSGVAWLGNIPEHWKVIKIRRLCLVKRGASPRPIEDPIYFDDDGEYSWVRIADVTASEKYLMKTQQKLSELGKSKSVPLEPGEIFLSIAATVGKPIITKIKCCIHDGFVYFDGLKENIEFLYYVFSCGEAYKGLGKLGTQLNLNTDTIGDIYIPLPRKKEQEKIVEYLDNKNAKINRLIAKIHKAIDGLKEYRTALISAAVTGKIDVREEAA